MKKKGLSAKLVRLGWWKYGEGANHEKWTNGGQKTTVLRHREINEYTARAILKIAESHSA